MSRLLIVDDEEKIRQLLRKYAEFDGHQVDFDQMIARLGSYREQEKIAAAGCNLHAEAVKKGLQE